MPVGEKAPIPETKISNLQKVSDVYDLFDPAVDYIIREIIGVEPVTNRRNWEQAMIFLALHEAGALHSEADGLGLGVGVETTIFSFAALTRKVIATDLYHSAGGWADVRTDLDPTAHIMKKAPRPVNNVTGMHMDMRNIEFEDDTFDYAWSTGSFEHIGRDEDFIRHLNEVHRVLKPGGVYAFTTAITYQNETQPTLGNYFFHPEHLMEIVHASKLLPSDEFDCGIIPHAYNHPITNRGVDYGFPLGKELLVPMVSFTRGLVNAANLVVARKDAVGKSGAQKPIVRNFDAAKEYLWKEARRINNKLWSTRQYLNVEDARKSDAKVIQLQYFGNRRVRFEVGFVGTPPEAATVQLRERSVQSPVTGRLLETKTLRDEARVTIDFEAKQDMLYRLTIEGDVKKEDVVVWAHQQPLPS